MEGIDVLLLKSDELLVELYSALHVCDRVSPFTLSRPSEINCSMVEG